MNATRPMRTARAAVFAVACLGVSAAGHVWMSGRPIPVTVLVPGFALVFAVALAVAGRSRGFPLIAGLMLAGEAGLHLLFSAAQHSGAGTGTAAMPGMSGISGMTMPGMSISGMSMPGMPNTPTAPGLVPMTAVAGAGMVAVHAVAGLICAWWLHRGECAFFALLAWLLGEAAAVLLPPAAHAGVRFVLTRPGMRILRVRRRHTYPEPLLHVLVRRGPPEPGLAR
jgi:hypothetical protein